MCSYLYPFLLSQMDGLGHGRRITCMAATGNVAGGDMGKQQMLITHPLPYITIEVYPMRLQNASVRILKILQILKKVTRARTRNVHRFCSREFACPRISEG